MDNLYDFKLLLNDDSASDDALYALLLRNARAWILAYTGRAEEQWLPEFDTALLSVAAVDYNRLGAEGAARQAEGGVDTAFLPAGDYPRSVTRALDRFRLIKPGFYTEV